MRVILCVQVLAHKLFAEGQLFGCCSYELLLGTKVGFRWKFCCFLSFPLFLTFVIVVTVLWF